MFKKYRDNYCLAAYPRNLIIDKNMKSILEMQFSPLAKYFLFSCDSEKGIFSNKDHEEADREGR